MSIYTSALKSIFRKLKKIKYISWILPSDRMVNILRKYYVNLITFPALFYLMHPESFYKGVLAGPFVGTRFTPKTSWSSAPYFFLGTYEKELEFIWSFLLDIKNEIKNILIIGAAEGYYVCGLGRIFHESNITAYEISEESRKILALNTHINHLDDRVTILGNCDYFELYSQLKNKVPDVILCDIEGYEHSLFTTDILAMLMNTILIIEVHPPYDLLTKVSQLGSTHQLFEIEPRTRTLEDYPVSDIASATKKYEWMNEQRPFNTPWILALPHHYTLTIDSK